MSTELNIFDLMVPAETLERRLDAMRRALDDLAAALDDAEKENTVPAMPVPSTCLLYTSPSPRDGLLSRMPSSA